MTKRPALLRTLGCIIACFALSGCGGAVDEAHSDQPEANAPTDEQRNEPAAQQPPPTTSPATVVHVDDVTWTILKVGQAQSVGPKYSHNVAAPNATYLSVYLTSQNDGREPITVSSRDTFISTPDGHKYEIDPNATYAANCEFERNHLPLSLNPGIQKDVVVTFEIPKSELLKSPRIHFGKRNLIDCESIASVRISQQADQFSLGDVVYDYGPPASQRAQSKTTNASAQEASVTGQNTPVSDSQNGSTENDTVAAPSTDSSATTTGTGNGEQIQ